MGNMVKAAFFIIILRFDSKEEASIKDAQIKLQDAQAVADAVQKLQTSSLYLTGALQIVDGMQVVLQCLKARKLTMLKKN